MIYVIAGTYAQYEDYLLETNTSARDAKYVSKTEQLLGILLTTKIVLYGSYQDHKIDWEYIHGTFKNIEVYKTNKGYSRHGDRL